MDEIIYSQSSELKHLRCLELLLGLWPLITSSFLFLAILFFHHLIYLTFTAFSWPKTRTQGCLKAPYPKTLGLSLCNNERHVPLYRLQQVACTSSQVGSIPKRNSRNSFLQGPGTHSELYLFFLHLHRFYLFNQMCGKAAVQLNGGCYKPLVMPVIPNIYWLSCSTYSKGEKK